MIILIDFVKQLLYKYNMVLREVVKITGPQVSDVWDYFPTRREVVSHIQHRGTGNFHYFSKFSK